MGMRMPSLAQLLGIYSGGGGNWLKYHLNLAHEKLI